MFLFMYDLKEINKDYWKKKCVAVLTSFDSQYFNELAFSTLLYPLYFC